MQIFHFYSIISILILLEWDFTPWNLERYPAWNNAIIEITNVAVRGESHGFRTSVVKVATTTWSYTKIGFLTRMHIIWWILTSIWRDPVISNPINAVPTIPIKSPTQANAFGMAKRPVPAALFIKFARDPKSLQKKRNIM